MERQRSLWPRPTAKPPLFELLLRAGADKDAKEKVRQAFTQINCNTESILLTVLYLLSSQSLSFIHFSSRNYTFDSSILTTVGHYSAHERFNEGLHRCRQALVGGGCGGGRKDECERCSTVCTLLAYVGA